jgi:hypothetical protein
MFIDRGTMNISAPFGGRNDTRRVTAKLSSALRTASGVGGGSSSIDITPLRGDSWVVMAYAAASHESSTGASST